ncbi:MAG: hypothetical protein Q8M50_13095 [Hydrogenophaga sp.]|uniref:hypothetical protein n=2 Tax=Hydrogenophaga sp. TaxID=1904254 RepID=UPI002730E6D7|nr:hypothetical protein [Hydrogenophaga sp.]MDP2407179.1 hypothetical protein [Hydrogenophaga sp.]
MSRAPRPGGLLLATLLGALGPAQAQTPPAAAAPPAPAYVDRVIEGLQPETLDEDAGYDYDRAGWPRFLRLETRLGTQPFDEGQRTRLGYSLYGWLETPNHGTLSLDGSFTPGDRQGTLTLRQRGMPLTDGWLANHELGIISTPAPDITRLPSRVFVPTSILQGVGGEWEHPGRGLQLQAATGVPGQLQIQPASGFERLSGRRTTLGAQWRLDADSASNPPGVARQGWTLALQHESAQDVTPVGSPSPSGNGFDAHATLVAARHEDTQHRLQARAMSSSVNDARGSPAGYWLEGEWDDGPRRYGAGLYRLDPGLNWANLPMANDITGAQLSARWRSRQWSAEGSVDWLRSVSGRRAAGYYATSSARWRLNRDSGIGLGMALRNYAGQAWSSYGDYRWQNDWGTSGLRLELEGGASQAWSQMLSYDQDWAVPQGWTLSTSVGLGHAGPDENTGLPTENLWSTAISVSAPVTSRASLHGSLNTEHASASASRNSLNLGASWRIDTRWSLEGNAIRSTGRSRTRNSIDPLAPPQIEVNTRAYRSFQAVLRYEMQAGSLSVPMGGKPSEGGGRIEGVVYFDANRSGTQEASETGAPGVTIYLDNRYAVRTDTQGRFEFPFVASGPRTVSVRNETLPLPWSVVDEGQVKVDVRLRETTQLSLPVQRAD